MKEIPGVIIQTGLLFLWGVVALGFVLTGKISIYLHPFFHFWVAGAGFLSLALGASLIFFFLSPFRFPITYRVQKFNRFDLLSLIHLLVLSLPLISLVLLSPSQFSEAFLLNRGIVTSPLKLPDGDSSFSYSANRNREPYQESSDNFPQNDSGSRMITPLDVIYASQIEEIKEQLQNADVEIVGQFLLSKPQTETAGEFLIVRMFIICCAADAVPVAVFCKTQHALDFPNLSWIKASGKICFPEENGEAKPIFLVRDVEAVDAPPEKFIF